MNKPYLLLITILVLAALAIGAVAFYKTASKPSRPIAPQPSPTTTPQPPATSSSDIDPSKNTLPLTIATPAKNAQVNTPNINVSGTTAAGADVSVNDKDITADAQGRFTISTTLEEGDNYLLVTAGSENGFAEWEGTVTYTP